MQGERGTHIRCCFLSKDSPPLAAAAPGPTPRQDRGRGCRVHHHCPHLQEHVGTRQGSQHRNDHATHGSQDTPGEVQGCRGRRAAGSGRGRRAAGSGRRRRAAGSGRGCRAAGSGRRRRAAGSGRGCRAAGSGRRRRCSGRWLQRRGQCSGMLPQGPSNSTSRRPQGPSNSTTHRPQGPSIPPATAARPAPGRMCQARACCRGGPRLHRRCSRRARMCPGTRTGAPAAVAGGKGMGMQCQGTSLPCLPAPKFKGGRHPAVRVSRPVRPHLCQQEAACCILAAFQANVRVEAHAIHPHQGCLNLQATPAQACLWSSAARCAHHTQHVPPPRCPVQVERRRTQHSSPWPLHTCCSV